VENPDHLERPKMRDPKPNWLKVRAPGGETYTHIKQTLRGLDLHTVCEEARCPNVGECWSKGTATVMVLGDVCTRGCRFCAVTSGHPKGVVDAREPENVASAVAALGLKYVVLTMVDRDDLPDGGAAHVRDTVLALRRLSPGLLVETLVGDFAGDFSCVDTVLSGGPSVYGHNIEVVRRLTPLVRDRRCSFDRSLDLLSYARKKADEKPQNDELNSEKWTRYVKSSLMVGVGETDDEVVEAMADLRKAGVDIVTLGQYLRPSPKHLPVDRYVTPEQFERWQTIGQAMGFAFVASGPLVRSSYHAAEAFVFATEGESAGDSVGELNVPPPAVALPTGLVEAQRLLQKSRNSV
jgi:lipoic acid synthetase